MLPTFGHNYVVCKHKYVNKEIACQHNGLNMPPYNTDAMSLTSVPDGEMSPPTGLLLLAVIGRYTPSLTHT